MSDVESENLSGYSKAVGDKSVLPPFHIASLLSSSSKSDAVKARDGSATSSRYGYNNYSHTSWSLSCVNGGKLVQSLVLIYSLLRWD